MKLGIPVIAVIILSITIVSISAEESLIPIWIKVIAEFWVGGELSDKEFISAMEWLIENKFIKISNTDDSGWKNEADKLYREKERLADEISELKNENRDLRTQLGKSTITTTSKPTEFNPYYTWDISDVSNIGGITVNVYQLGFMKPNDQYFGLDIGVTWTRGGNPVELGVQDLLIVDENGYVYTASDEDKKKFDGLYTEDRTRRVIVLYDDMPKNFKELDIVVTVLDKHVVDDSYTFTFRYTF